MVIRNQDRMPDPLRDRVVRVFVSSTFRDMHAEREELVKRIFPQLRHCCEQRAVTWTEVDLRWGITDEQRAEGKVLPICLEEIHRCRPFFIGLLGERYGWIPEPEQIPDDLAEREPWLSEHKHKSVTELEILHGVLNNPAMSHRAFFYFRDPAYVARVPAAQRADFCESDPDRHEKLVSLKERIRASGMPVRERYPDPQTLGRMVLEDLAAAIDRMFPPETVPDPLDREAMEHEAFVRSRAGIYIHRREYFERLDRHAAEDGLPLVILGDSGCGKSALLANWALRHRRKHPGDFLILHFVGASTRSTDWAMMVRRIMGELKRRFHIPQDIPDRPDHLRSAFANWLHMAAARGRTVLVLDGLNQLEDRDQAPDLAWLPETIPARIRLLVSTLPGRALEEWNRRRWPGVRVNPLEKEECERLIERYLGSFSKRLSARQIERIATATQCANPLYLRSLLEELRLLGDPRQLEKQIGHYLAAPTVSQLFEKILARFERDYERERPGLVRAAMSRIWASRRGLSEAELLEMLGKKHSPLPRAYWSPLYLASESSLVNRSGLIGISHAYFREAVRKRYLPTGRIERSGHRRLAAYFYRQGITSRKADELPWQLAQSENWSRLHNLLAEPKFFEFCWGVNPFEVKRYWTLVEANSKLRLLNAYRPLIEHPQSHLELVRSLATLLAGRGHLTEAFSLWEFLAEHHRRIGDLDGLQASLSSQAGILRLWGRLEEAMALYRQAAQVCRERKNRDGLRISLGSQAVILYGRGHLEEAMALCKQEQEICQELGNEDGLSASLGNQGSILKDRGCLQEAMDMFQQVEQLCRRLGNKDGLATSLGNQALIFQTWRDWDKAMCRLKQQQEICSELGNKDGLQISLGEEASVLYARGRLEEAMDLYERKARFARELGKKQSLAISLGNQAGILGAWGRFQDAIALLEEQERICRKLDNPEGLATALANRASLLSAKLKRPKDALPLAEEAFQIATDHSLAVLARQIALILDSVRRAAEDTGMQHELAL